MSVRALLAATVLAATAALAPACGARVTAPPRAASASASASASVGQASAACASCHAEIASEWRASFHRTAFTDATFQVSLALEEPKEHAFCTRCHAPATTASLTAAPTAAATARGGVEVGVDCVACHAGAHAGAEARAGAEAGASAEARASAGASAEARAGAGAGAGVCARCHEFTFDDGRPDLVQETVSEHAASIYTGVACAECHMPARDGHKDHRFVSGHAPSQIARAVRVDVERAPERGADALRVAIRVDAGHAFPTGDMFRRARLMVFAEGARGEIVADAERTFGRTWGGVTSGEHAGARLQQSDTRIRGSWAEVIDLGAPSAPIVRVRWTLLYERVVAMRGPHVSIASSDTIAEGELRW